MLLFCRMQTAAPSPTRVTLPLNTFAAAVLWGALLGHWLYPLGAFAGLWPPLLAPGTKGDYPLDSSTTIFIMVGVGATLGGIVGLLAIAGQLRWGWSRRGGTIAVELLRFYLAYCMLGYGLMKVFGHQFSHLWADLDTPPADLSPMQVMWQFFGYSQSYQFLLGWVEVLAALLLLYQRTVLLGALLTAAAMFNVVALDYFFHVGVLLDAVVYVAAALLITAQDAPRFWQFFVTNQPTAPRGGAATWFATPQGHQRYRRVCALATALVLLKGVELILKFVFIATKHDPTPLTGIWQPARVEQWHRDHWLQLALTDTAYPHRLYFQGGEAVFRNGFRRDQFRYQEAPVKQLATLSRYDERFNYPPSSTWQYRRTGRTDTLHLTGVWRQDSIRLVLVPAPLGTLAKP